LLGVAKSGRGAPSSIAASPSVVAARKLITSVPLLLVALTIALTGCGESKQEQAKKSVCSARSDIKSRIAALQTLTPSIATLPQVKTEVSAIADDLKKIKGAQGDLEPARKQQVEQATQTFKQQVEAVLSNLTANLSISGAGAQLESALKQLASSYTQALQPIECS
jgi:predicted flap endonuclease-1-like 5' DNA nuclease